MIKNLSIIDVANLLTLELYSSYNFSKYYSPYYSNIIVWYKFYSWFYIIYSFSPIYKKLFITSNYSSYNERDYPFSENIIDNIYLGFKFLISYSLQFADK